MQISQILFYILIAFGGYAIGRIGHIYAGHIKSPHHWIYGLALMIAGFYLYKYSHQRKILKRIGITAFYFGVGLLISDFKDFLQLKFFGIDELGEKKFWGID